MTIDLDNAEQDIPGATHVELMTMAYELVAELRMAKSEDEIRAVPRGAHGHDEGACTQCDEYDNGIRAEVWEEAGRVLPELGTGAGRDYAANKAKSLRSGKQGEG